MTRGEFLNAADTSRVRSRVVRIIPKIATFFGGQIIVQALTFVAGFLSLRWLSIEQYAWFGLAFAFQSVANIVVDCGFSNTIIALVGERSQDPVVVGSYIRSARHYRNRLFVIATPLTAVFFFSIGWQHGWPFANLFPIFLGIALTIWLQGSMMVQSVLIMNGRLRHIYGAQLAAAGTRVLLLYLLHLVGLLNAVSAVWIGVAAYAACTTLLRFHSKPFMNVPDRPSPVHNRECRRVALPQTPPILFYAFQGQITLAMISVFGSTRNIAEVAALGRIGQLFTLFGMFNGLFVEPVMARTPERRVRFQYAGIFICSTAVAALMVLLCGMWPNALLWVLGPHYSNMGGQVVLLVAAAAIGYIAHAVWVMNLARKFLAWWYTSLQVVGVLGAQCAAIPFLKLSTTSGVLELSIVSASATLLTHLIGGAVGLAQLRTSRLERDDPHTIEPQIATVVT